MPLPEFLKKKMEGADEESASDEGESSSEEASESASDEADAPAVVKKGGKVNPLLAWAKKKKG